MNNQGRYRQRLRTFAASWRVLALRGLAALLRPAPPCYSVWWSSSGQASSSRCSRCFWVSTPWWMSSMTDV